MPRGGIGPRWVKSIGFRMGLMLSLLLLGGYLGLPLVWNAALAAVGLPTLDQEIVELSDPGEARLLPLSDLQFIAAHLLADARPEGPGAWLPDPERAQAIERSLAGWGQTYAWLSADRKVLACSAGLPFAAGDVFDRGLGSPEAATTSRPFGDVTLGRIVTHVRKGGELAGWLLIYGRPPLGDLTADGVLVESAAPSVRAWSNRVVNLVASLFVIIAALSSAFFVSRMITGRVTRLAHAASSPIDDPHDLPGPFPEEGDDELAVLARSLNGMRSKVQELIGDLDRQDQERRRWIAQVSHDLRTPLTALTACLDGAREELGEGSLPSLAARLDAAQHDALRLAELIEDLLDIARLEAGEAPVKEPVPPAELVRQAARGLRALAEQGNIRLKIELETGLPVLEADGRRLMRALENLMRNAIHHARGSVVVRAELCGELVRFTVEDDGPGLPEVGGVPADLKTLSEHLSRPDSAGLGLVVVRRVAQMHGGSAAAENRVEGGARFWLDLPQA